MCVTRITTTIAICLVILAVASIGRAQSGSTGAIGGTARDSTGAVLPGVTVEAASPALIEKVRVAVTDAQGNYKITELRPGTYSVTFTLPGFSTFKREGIELTAGFTAAANADMKVGGLEETVTVTGASPVVDVQNVRTQQVLRQDVLEALPSGQRDMTQLASLTLGVTPSTAGRNDVGGDKAETATGLTIHGGRGDDGKVNYDGMVTNNLAGGGQRRIYKFNQIMVQEVVIETGGNSLESETGGANVNMVPRDGGNKFSVHSVVSYTNGSLSSAKVPDSLITRGSAPNQNSMKDVFDYGIGVGGPIKNDKLWFYEANRVWGSAAYGANNYFNKSSDWRFYVPDLSRPAYTDQWQRDFGGRITWQATAKQKVTASENWQKGCSCWLAVSSGAPLSPEAQTSFQYGPNGGLDLAQGTWTYTATSKLLLQAGLQYARMGVLFTNDVIPDAQHVSILELVGVPGGAPAGYRYNALPGSNITGYTDPTTESSWSEHFALSYVTGSHAIKTGWLSVHGGRYQHGRTLPNGLNYTFRAGVPVSLTEWATPFDSPVQSVNVGFFGQDQWTIGRLTATYGARLDHYNASTKAFTSDAGPLVGPKSFPAVTDLPNFNDVTPRFGVAYDVFGNGKTAIKASWGRYLMNLGTSTLDTVAPSGAIVTNVTRTWNDTNHDYVPNCDLTNPLANGECGPMSNLRFGQPAVNLVWDQASRTGWNTREFNYQTAVSLQQEVRPGLGLTLGYYRTDWRNQLATVNTLVTPSDFTQYCITAPTDPRLAQFSGQPVCGLYDVNPNKFGQVSNVLMLAKDVPGATSQPREVFSGVDTGITARFGKGGLVSGGVTVGRTTFDYCWENNLPQVLQVAAPTTLPRTSAYCKVQTAWWDGVGSMIKFQAVYPLPWNFVASGTFKNMPGAPLAANDIVSNAQAATSLGRSFSSCPATGVCTATATVGLIPGANNQGNASALLFDDRLTQVDLRVTRMIRLGKGRIQGVAELYNVLNARPAQATNPTYGASWLVPTSILGGRLFKFGTQIDF
jgi:hypothetical protein